MSAQLDSIALEILWNRLLSVCNEHGLVTSFVAFTLFATWVLGKLGLRDDRLRQLAIAMLFVLAATLLVPQFARLIERPFARLTRYRAGGGGFLLGLSLGLVFTPCAGPVFGTVSTVAAEQHVGWRVIVLALAYAAGAAVPMLAIAFGGRGAAVRLRAHDAALRIASGALIAFVAFVLAFHPYNIDTRLQTAVPGYVNSLQNWIEKSHTSKRALATVHHVKQLKAKPPTKAHPAGGLPNYGVAPALAGTGDWYNSPPLTLKQLRGKVVLIDFWTYSCINCLRTLPHLESWYAAYHSKGLVIIGVHTPEFAFEHVSSNVASAVKRLGINYPVVQDNNYDTWNAYGNDSWPSEYLIDRQGDIVHHSVGEGEYGKTENLIRTLLDANGVKAKRVPNLTPTEPMSPETYLGFNRLEYYFGSTVHPNKMSEYTFRAAPLPVATVAYAGQWKVTPQYILAGANAQLKLHFVAKHVYLVLGGRGHVDISINGKQTGAVDVTSYRLFTLYNSKRTTNATLGLRFSPGVQAYAFTFG